MFASLYSVPPARADAMLRLVGLDDKAGTRTEKLSGGQAQRLSIACALVHDPELVFLDEPTGALDPQAAATCGTCSTRSTTRAGPSILTTQHMDEAEALCDRVAIMDHGRILELNSPTNLVRGLDAPVRVSIEPGALGDDEARALPGADEVVRDEGRADHLHPQPHGAAHRAGRA